MLSTQQEVTQVVAQTLAPALTGTNAATDEKNNKRLRESTYNAALATDDDDEDRDDKVPSSTQRVYTQAPPSLLVGSDDSTVSDEPPAAALSQRQGKEQAQAPAYPGERQLVREDETTKIFRESFLRAGHGGLAQFYRQVSGTVTTPYKKIKAPGSSKEKLLRHGNQVWRDASGRVVRTRTFVDGKCHGEEIVWCDSVACGAFF